MKEFLTKPLLVLDLDGTITMPAGKGLYTPLIEFLRTYDAPIIFASNRGAEPMSIFLRDMGLANKALAVAENGGILVQNWDITTLYATNLDLGLVVAEAIGAGIQLNLVTVIPRTTDILLYKKGTDTVRLARYIAEAYPGLYSLTIAHTAIIANLHYTHVDKAYGFLKAIEVIGWTGPILCAGNDTNDLCFKKIGYTIAASDAFGEYLEIADFVAESPGGEGVLDTLLKLIPHD
jgi:phosphoglycolate phosphatase